MSATQDEDGVGVDSAFRLSLEAVTYRLPFGYDTKLIARGDL
jgi:hypothetical protein